ncbi:MAG TPA: RNA polymerase sigma-70 factor [Chitinophagaceae bacterium]|nr:RNA polymerase sigma-70 factor [Chitinophagaceae bacterium]
MTNELDKGDDNVLSEFRQGNARALTTIFDHYYEALCYFAERLVADTAEARDIVEESFIKLWELRENFGTMQNVKAFLYITTRNTCFNSLKHSERISRQQQEIAYLLRESDDLAIAEVTRAELLREVYAAIESLPPQCRKIIQMSFVEGKKNNDIAEELGLSLQTVKNQKSRALELLKTRLAGKSAWILVLLHLHFSNKN